MPNINLTEEDRLRLYNIRRYKGMPKPEDEKKVYFNTLYSPEEQESIKKMWVLDEDSRQWEKTHPKSEKEKEVMRKHCNMLKRAQDRLADEEEYQKEKRRNGC